MSGTIISSSPGVLGSLISDSAQTRRRLDQLTEQAGSGLNAQTYDGLGAAASIPLSLNPQIADLKAWQDNISSASAVQQATQAAMTQLQQIASNFHTQSLSLASASASTIDTAAASARDALQQVAGILDTQVGGVYIFGGADSGTPPVPQPDQILSSGFYTGIASVVGSLAANGGAATASATLGIAASNSPGVSPFSAYLSQPATALLGQAPVVQVGPNESQPVGLLASANTAAASPSGSTTGSYMRDLMRGLATLGSLSSAQMNGPGFASLVQDTTTSLNGVISAMAEDAAALGARQSSLTNSQSTLAAMQTALTTQVSTVQDADMTKTISDLSLVQTQLQASYQLIAGLNSVSLAKLLPFS